ncbi:MAG: RNA-binding protein [Syntrophobacteraceae bacterium]|jgi:RNA recognition motif-containing protein|nr:RNA-binding protein [Syntrophobacteraceae bacterium]
MTNIFVGSLSFKTTEEELRKEFEVFGEVSSVKIIEDRETRKSRGFAFVEMPDRQQAMAAITAMNGKDLAGQTLKVNEAKPREARTGPSRERSGGGHGFSTGGSRTHDQKNADIYDSKDRRSGAPGSRGRGGRGPGGRPSGGRRSH